MPQTEHTTISPAQLPLPYPLFLLGLVVLPLCGVGNCWGFPDWRSLQISKSTLFFLFWLYRAAPMAYEGSQARGWIGATVAGLHHSSWQRWIPDPLSEAREWTHILMDASGIRFYCTAMGTPSKSTLKEYCLNCLQSHSKFMDPLTQQFSISVWTWEGPVK